MANTVTQRTLLGSGSDRNIVRSIHIVSDGTQESDTIVYDNSTFVNDVAKGRLKKVWLSGSDCVARLEWDQTTDSPVFAGNPSTGGYWDFSEFGGMGNPNESGATGDLLLTTSGLAAGEELFMVIHVVQN